VRRLGALALCLAACAASAAPALAAGPPSVSGASATDIQGVSALLGAQVNPNGLPSAYRFEYVDQARFEADQPDGFKAAKSSPEEALGAGTQPRPVSVAVSGLSAGTAYRYRALAASSAGTTIGPEGTFTTTGGFGFAPGPEGFGVRAEEQDGSADARAGSHPYALTTTIKLNLGGEFADQPALAFTDGDLKDLHLQLPPGLIENPAAVPRCTQAQFHTPRQSPFGQSLSGESCSDKSQIGVVAVKSSFAAGSTRYFGVFNLVPPPGAPSQLGFAPFGAPIAFTPHIRGSEGGYGLTLDLEGLSQAIDISALKISLWGTPWLMSHDSERGDCLNEEDPQSPFGEEGTPLPEYKAGSCSIGDPRKERPLAYLTLPTFCGAPMSFSATADAWQQPATVSASSQSQDAKGNPLSLSGCGLLAFSSVASATVAPTTADAASASGLDFDLTENEEGLLSEVNAKGVFNPQARAPAQIKKAVLTLPEGITINPSLAAGLGVCTPAQYSAETLDSAPGAGCPNAAKIGDVRLESPLFAEAITGSLYLAEPDDPTTKAPGAENPFDSLLALYILAKSPQRGVLVKVAGEVSADPSTGQLTASFDNLPQLPYSRFRLHFREGQRSALITPSTCGAYLAPVDLAPWPNPASVLHDTAQFQLSAGAGGGACPTGAAAPFDPAAAAGTLQASAGSYSPFYLHLTRADAEQEITSYSTRLPPGLLANIAGVPYCPDSAIEAAKQRSGKEEEAHPSCPPGSQIGHTVSGYGLGSVLAYAPGGLYLAGPFHGAPLSVVAIDAATVGPFDLGTIVVRSAVEVDPHSAQVFLDSAGSDPIPHIRQGIPLHLRDIRAYIDRPAFTLNPTSCDPSQITSTLSGSAAPFTDPKDASASPADPFQAAFCSELAFKPKLSLKLSAAKHGAFPALRAVYTPRPGDANIKSAQVTLPPTEFLEQRHIKTICTRAQSLAASCPAGSIYGHAAAFTPLLAAPLEGPVYLRSSAGVLPDLVASLSGQGIRIDLEGRIDSSQGGLRATFQGLPDAPVSKFLFGLDGGKRGILVNAKSLCAAAYPAKARLLGQNNKGEISKPALATRCRAKAKR
jgi:hypothetical protein